MVRSEKMKAKEKIEMKFVRGKREGLKGGK